MIAYGDSRAAANNLMAIAQQAGAGRSFAGSGLSRGGGQRSMDAYRSDTARAAGQLQASSAMSGDAQSNALFDMDSAFRRRGDRLQYDSLAEQYRQSQWDSRFNNLTTAWGALAGLLR